MSCLETQATPSSSSQILTQRRTAVPLYSEVQAKACNVCAHVQGLAFHGPQFSCAAAETQFPCTFHDFLRLLHEFATLLVDVNSSRKAKIFLGKTYTRSTARKRLPTRSPEMLEGMVISWMRCSIFYYRAGGA